MTRALAVLLCLPMALAGCSSLPPINPPKPPDKPPVQACMEGVPWCSEVGQQCSSATSPCKHNPTQDPNHCELAPSCGGGGPINPPAETSCAPVLDPAKLAPPNDAAKWPKAADQSTDQAFKSAVWAAVDRAKAACPAAWAGQCMSNGVAGIDNGYALIAKELQRAGFAASQAKDSEGKIYDHLYVQRSSGSADWNATKLFFYGNGCLITGDGAFTVHGWYTWTGGPFTPPTPSPTPAPTPAPTPSPTPAPTPAPDGTCPIAPCPALSWTEATIPDGWSRDEIGRARMHFNSSVYVGRCEDNTLVVTRNEPYCAAIGMSPMANGILRDACPLRPDGHPDREALEQWASLGFKIEGKDGAHCDPCPAAPDNPVMFALGSSCRICTVRTFKDGPLCSEYH